LTRTDARGGIGTGVFAINSAGTAVGYAGASAVYWGADAVPVDLNTLIDPASGWRLEYALDISDTGWIAGIGRFDPNGAGGQAAYLRHFLIHVPMTASTLPGDFNSDGAVDAADYVVWRNTGGSPDDYNDWRANFGATAGSGAALPSAQPLSATVPKPTGVVLVFFAAGAAILATRHRTCTFAWGARASSTNKAT
jgi:hypothetical protein